MRTIKFRAWNKEDKRMYLNAQNAYDWIDGEQPDGENFPATSFGQVLNDEDWEVMQFTGLTDRNGKEIYEGDVVETNNYEGKNCFVVVFETEYCGALSAFIYRFIGGEAKGTESSVHCQAIETGEVIGNVWENPELISKTKTRYDH